MREDDGGCVRRVHRIPHGRRQHSSLPVDGRNTPLMIMRQPTRMPATAVQGPGSIHRWMILAGWLLDRARGVVQIPRGVSIVARMVHGSVGKRLAVGTVHLTGWRGGLSRPRGGCRNFEVCLSKMSCRQARSKGGSGACWTTRDEGPVVASVLVFGDVGLG